MSLDTRTAAVSNKMLWAGWVMSALPVLVLLASAAAKFMKPEGFEKGFRDLGWDEGYALGLGIVEIVCTVIYVMPRTAVLGAILLTGYFGGAIATHVRIGDPSAAGAIILGVLVWGGLYLRDARLRALIPLRS
jgi:hypothetical protein